MTQEQDRKVSTSYKRTTRQNRNRPVLVTQNSLEQETKEQAREKTSATVADAPSAVASPAPKRFQRLPGFFSTVGKNTQSEEPREKEVADARLARALRGKESSKGSNAETPKLETKESTKTESRGSQSTKAATSARPASPFKTRYILGMVLYLICANFIGQYEAQFLRSQNLERLLFTLGPIPVYASTLLFLATLIAILVLLARLDLIPRSLGAMSGQSRSSTSNKNDQSVSDGSKPQQPAMRQGVKGADDDLYQEYMANRRREKKK